MAGALGQEVPEPDGCRPRLREAEGQGHLVSRDIWWMWRGGTPQTSALSLYFSFLFFSHFAPLSRTFFLPHTYTYTYARTRSLQRRGPGCSQGQLDF